MEIQLSELALIVGCFLVVLAPSKTSNYATLLSVESIWTISAFFLPGTAALLTISQPDDTSDTSLIIRFVPLLLVSLFMVVKSIGSATLFIPSYTYFFMPIFGILLAFAVSGNASTIMTIVSMIPYIPMLFTPSRPYSLEKILSGGTMSVKLLCLLVAALSILPGFNLIGPCRLDKCSIWGESLGAEGQGNALGMLFAFVSVLIYLGSKNKYSLLLSFVGTFLIVDLTSSRSAMLAWTCSLFMYLTFRVSNRIRMSWPLGVSVTLLSAAVIFIATYSWRLDEFTGRASLWAQAIDLFAKSPFFGYGSSFWVRQPATSLLNANYSTHSIFWEMIVSVGVVGLTLFVGGIVVLIFHVSHRTRMILLLFVGTWLSGSILEVLAAPGRFYLVPAVLPFILLIAATQPAESRSSSSRQPVIRDTNSSGSATGSVQQPDPWW